MVSSAIAMQLFVRKAISGRSERNSLLVLGYSVMDKSAKTLMFDLIESNEIDIQFRMIPKMLLCLFRKRDRTCTDEQLERTCLLV